jgi:hypothetical protein
MRPRDSKSALCMKILGARKKIWPIYWRGIADILVLFNIPEFLIRG